MVICLKRGADLHMAQLMPPALTVSWFSKIQTGFTFLVQAHPGSPRQRAIKRVCVCVSVGNLFIILCQASVFLFSATLSCMHKNEQKIMLVF